MESLQNGIALGNPNAEALDALERWMVAKGTYDAQTRAAIKAEARLTGELPTRRLDPGDTLEAQAIWRAAAWYATGPAAGAGHAHANGFAAAPIPWQDFKDELMRLYQPPLRSPTTRRGMAHALRCLDTMGVQSTADLVPALIADLAAGRPATNSPNTVAALLRYIQAACSYAEKMGYVRVSPFRIRGLSTYAQRAPSRGRKHASREEIRRVLDHMKEQAQADGWKGWKAKRLYAMTACLSYTGARAGEVYYLQVQDVDLEEGIIWIASRREHKVKTTASAQPLPMAPSLIAIIAEYLPHRMSVPPGFKINSPDCPWLFPTTRRHLHTPWTSENGWPGTKPRDRIKAVAAQVGVIGLTPIVLRHSMATHLMTSWGGSPGLVKRVLRHTTETTAAQWYIHDDLPGLKEAFKNVEF